MRLLTNLESATFGGYSTSTWTWSSLSIGFDQARLESRGRYAVEEVPQAFPVARAASVKTFLRYFVTKTKWTCNAKTQCLPVRKSFVFAIDQLYNRSMQIRKGYKYRLKTNRSTG